MRYIHHAFSRAGLSEALAASAMVLDRFSNGSSFPPAKSRSTAASGVPAKSHMSTGQGAAKAARRWRCTTRSRFHGAQGGGLIRLPQRQAGFQVHGMTPSGHKKLEYGKACLRSAFDGDVSQIERFLGLGLERFGNLKLVVESGDDLVGMRRESGLERQFDRPCR